MIFAGLGPRGNSKLGSFKIFFDFPVHTLTMGPQMRHQDRNNALKNTVLEQGCPQDHVPTATACVVRGLFSLWLCWSRVPCLLSLSPRSDLFKASEMQLAKET